MLSALVPFVTPFASRWVRWHEQQILSTGVALDEGEAFDAHLAGVAAPLKIRLQRVEEIPLPQQPALKALNHRLRLISPATSGITFGYGIYIRAEHWGRRSLLVHEFVHVGQYERLGGVDAFLRAYLRECVTVGYPEGPLEQEAIERTKEICFS